MFRDESDLSSCPIRMKRCVVLFPVCGSSPQVLAAEASHKKCQHPLHFDSIDMPQNKISLHWGESTNDRQHPRHKYPRILWAPAVHRLSCRSKAFSHNITYLHKVRLKVHENLQISAQHIEMVPLVKTESDTCNQRNDPDRSVVMISEFPTKSIKESCKSRYLCSAWWRCRVDLFHHQEKIQSDDQHFPQSHSVLAYGPANQRFEATSLVWQATNSQRAKRLTQHSKAENQQETHQQKNELKTGTDSNVKWKQRQICSSDVVYAKLKIGQKRPFLHFCTLFARICAEQICESDLGFARVVLP